MIQNVPGSATIDEVENSKFGRERIFIERKMVERFTDIYLENGFTL